MPAPSIDLAELRSALEAVADPAQAPDMARYMKDRFAFLGVRSPQRRAAQKPWVTAVAAAGPQAGLEAAATLWEQPEREFQYVGCDLLARGARGLPAAALADVRRLVRKRSWWDTVDHLAKVVGTMVRTHPELSSRLDEWVRDEDMWVSRAAILHQLGWKDSADPSVVLGYCEQQIGHQDFFIRKAIGWALRDLARSYPEDVWAFVDSHPEMSGLSRREATKHR